MRANNYPTPAQVSVFVGNVWVDDAYRLEVRDQNQLIPLYGYADREFTAVAQGKRIVQGSIIINYRYPEYLRAAIDGYGHSKAEMDSAVALAHTLRNSSVEDRIKLIDQARMMGVGEEVAEVFTNYYMPSVGVGSDSDLRLLEESSGSNTLPSTMAMDPRKEIEFRIYFDAPENARYFTVVEGVRIVGRAMTVSNAAGGGDTSSSGQNLFEVYTFFARRIKNRKINRWTEDPSIPTVATELQEILDVVTPTPIVEGSGY